MFLRPGTITGYTPFNSNYLSVSSSAGGKSFPAVFYNSTGWCSMGHSSISYCALVFSIFQLFQLTEAVVAINIMESSQLRVEITWNKMKQLK